MDDVLLRTSPEYKEFRQEILRAIHLLDTSIAAHRPTIGTESYLTGEEVMELFSLCPRTLQNYRDRRVLPYTTIGSCESVLSNSMGGALPPILFYHSIKSSTIRPCVYKSRSIPRPPGSTIRCRSESIR